jgi:hypothetical protein
MSDRWQTILIIYLVVVQALNSLENIVNRLAMKLNQEAHERMRDERASVLRGR